MFFSLLFYVYSYGYDRSLIHEKKTDYLVSVFLPPFWLLVPVFIFSYVAAFLYLRLLDSKHGFFDHRIEGQYAELVIFFVYWPPKVPYS